MRRPLRLDRFGLLCLCAVALAAATPGCVYDLTRDRPLDDAPVPDSRADRADLAPADRATLFEALPPPDHPADVLPPPDVAACTTGSCSGTTPNAYCENGSWKLWCSVCDCPTSTASCHGKGTSSESCVVSLLDLTDAYTSSTATKKNYGDATTLEVSSTSGYEEKAYLDFGLPMVLPDWRTVQGLSLQKATLKFLVYSFSGSSPSLEIRFLAASWTESGIDYSNAPSAAASSPTVTWKAQYGLSAIDVTTVVQACLASTSGCTGLELSASSMTGAIYLASREISSSAPRLELTIH
jgi:hypothetical protein